MVILGVIIGGVLYLAGVLTAIMIGKFYVKNFAPTVAMMQELEDEQDVEKASRGYTDEEFWMSGYSKEEFERMREQEKDPVLEHLQKVGVAVDRSDY